MNKLQFTGRVTQILPAKSGTSQSGKAWTSQQFVVTEDIDQYPASACFQVFNEKVQIPNIGSSVTVHFNLKANEYNGRVFTNIDAWKIDVSGGVAQQPKPVSTPAERVEPPIDGDGDLPF